MILRALPAKRWPMTGGRESMFWLNGPRLRNGLDWGNVTPADMRATVRIFRDGGTLSFWGNSFSIQPHTRLCVDVDSFFDAAGKNADDVAPLLAAAHDELGGSIELLDGYYIPVYPISDRYGANCYTADQFRDVRKHSVYGDLTILDDITTTVAIRCSLRNKPWPYGEGYEGWNWIDVNLDSLPRWIDTVRKCRPGRKVGVWIEDASMEDATAIPIPKEKYAEIADKLVRHVGADLIVVWGEDGQIIPTYDACAALIRPPIRDPLRPPTRVPFAP